jgi:hypothetical protein
MMGSDMDHRQVAPSMLHKKKWWRYHLAPAIDHRALMWLSHAPLPDFLLQTSSRPHLDILSLYFLGNCLRIVLLSIFFCLMPLRYLSVRHRAFFWNPDPFAGQVGRKPLVITFIQPRLAPRSSHHSKHIQKRYQLSSVAQEIVVFSQTAKRIGTALHIEYCVG